MLAAPPEPPHQYKVSHLHKTYAPKLTPRFTHRNLHNMHNLGPIIPSFRVGLSKLRTKSARAIRTTDHAMPLTSSVCLCWSLRTLGVYPGKFHGGNLHPIPVQHLSLLVQSMYSVINWKRKTLISLTSSPNSLSTEHYSKFSWKLCLPDSSLTPSKQ